MSSIQRYVIKVSGVVQGVGFRPFIYQLATEYGVNGWVRNTSGYVEIDVEGQPASIDSFINDISLKAPPAACVEKVAVQKGEPVGYTRFEILQSQSHKDEYQLISPDLSTCHECVSEIMDPGNRRYRYAFTNCTNCGPRFTIIKDIPYDRIFTTMEKFKMCPQCQAEYDDPSNRRFHAQPNACPKCGPQLQLVEKDGVVVQNDDPVSATVKLLRTGKIVAIKGLGGFLLACDATNNETVNLLRQRKVRPSKPFAVMVKDVDEASKYCCISEEERDLLLSTHSPIVLVKLKEGGFVAPSIAPNLKYLGILLPYTPLHHLLMKEIGLPLVMTSGNLSEEPIAKDNEEALHRLSSIADYFLWHNRDIYVRYDDSVAVVVDGETRLARRARGYAPYPVHLPFVSSPVLACGAEMKGSFCLARDNHAFVSQHIGDMENEETLEHFQDTVGIYKKLFRINPGIVAYDMHPDYLSTRYALELKENDTTLKLCAVQHHHAHIASCMAENGIEEQVIGVSLDGTGYGMDGHIWGGEFLLADYKNFKRLAHLEYIPLPGGDASTKKPLRIAVAYLYYLLGEKALHDSELGKRMNDEEMSLIKCQIDRKLNSPLTSSCGRLFDAVSALIGVRDCINYEAQAAVELEMVATDFSPSDDTLYPFDIQDDCNGKVIRLGRLFDAILNDIRANRSKAEIAYRFHISLARTVALLCSKLSDETGVKVVALSGGVFQNRLLLHLTMEALKEQNLVVIAHKQVPTNDGGIALGQVAVANYADL
jgi:hydrogenase maturation protein HypF